MRLLIALLIFIACGKQPQITSKRDLNGVFEKADGTCISNIGHRVGGDFKGLEDNNPITAAKIKPFENENCFKCWEFDVNSAKDQMVVTHDYYVGDSYVRNVYSTNLQAWTLDNFLEDLMLLNPEKPLCFDVKVVLEKDYDDLVNNALYYRYQTDSIFLFSKSRVNGYSELVTKLEDNNFRIGTY